MSIGEFPAVPGYQALFAANNVSQSLLWVYFLALGGLIVGTRVMVMFGLWLASIKTVFYWSCVELTIKVI